VKRPLLIVAMLLMLTFGGRRWMDSAIGATELPHLEKMPTEIGEWRSVREISVPPDTLAVLRADGVLLRDYEVHPGSRVQLYVAYYRTQHAGESMHSPRNCLPGAGWEPVSSSFVSADLGGGRKQEVNRYLVEKEGKRMLVLYWYESRNRIIAGEYSGKLYLLWDSLRRQNRDGAIVRVTVPIPRGQSEDRALELSTQFIRSAAPDVTNVLFPVTGG